MSPVAEDFDPNEGGADIPQFTTTSLFGVEAGVAEAPVKITGGGGGNVLHHGPAATPGISTTLGQTIQDFWHLEPGSDALKNFQQDLFDAGLYPDSYYRAKNPSKLNLGVVDDVDANAWKEIAIVAARTGRPIMELLDERKAGFAATGGVGTTKGKAAADARAPFSGQVTSGMSLADTAQKAAEKTLGRGMSQKELDRFVKTYQAMETHADKAVYDNALSGGVSSAAPPAELAAAQQARQSAPTEAYANDLMNVYDKALAILTRKATPSAGG